MGAAAAKGIMQVAAKMAPLERLKYYRSFGKPKKEGIHTSVIGKQGNKSGLFYDPDLPFIENYQYFRKPSATVQAKAKKKGHTLKDEYAETRSRFIQPEEKDPFVMAQMTGDAEEGWRHKYVKVRQSEANWNDKAKKWILPLSKDSIRNPNRAKRIQEVINDISDNPEKHGLKIDPTKKIRIPYGSYVTAANKVLKNEGYKDIPVSSLKRAIVAKQGTSIVQLRGTDTEKKLHKFLKTIDPETKRPYYETITSSALKKKLPWLKSDFAAIHDSRRAAGLQRINIGGQGVQRTEARAIEAARKVKQKITQKHSYLGEDEVEAMAEQARIMLGGLKPGYKKRYPDKTIDEVFKFIEDTEILNRGKDPYYNSYLAEKALNRLRTALTGETHTMGHARKEAADTWWFAGYETPIISPQKWDINLKQRGVDTQFQAAIKRGDMGTAMKAYKKMLKHKMRSSMVDEFGEQIFYGAEKGPGKYAAGGLIKKGIEKLLKSTAFNQSRRKFLKQAGATAAYTALPTKTLAALAPKAASKAAARFAPPWIKSMVGIFDSLGSGKSYMSHTMANGTKIKTLGGTADDYRGKMTPFEVTNSDGYKVPVNVFKDKKGNIDIEFDIRDDFANNQHIYMDKKTGTVEIVDENYYMTGPDDYAKDDPLTWDVTTPTQMKDFEKKMGVMKGDVDDYMLDYASTPEDGSYSELFESFIDSFSPAGNIFKTKQKAEMLKNKKIQEETYKRAQAQRRLEDEEMKFESQFRGGSQHGYSHGGMANVRDKVGEFINPPNYRQLPAQANNWLAIQGNDQWEGLSKDQSRHKKTLSFDNPQSGIRAGIISLASRAARTNNSPKISLNQIFFGDSPWAENQGAYRKYFKDLNLPTNTIYDMSNRESVSSLINIMSEMEMGNEDYHSIDSGRRDHIVNQGIDMAYKRLIDPDYDYYSTYKNKFAGGGMARRPNAVSEKFSVDDAVAMIRANPQSFVGGGLVKKFAPKVLGKLTNFKPKITGTMGPKMYTPPKGPYGIMDENGSRVLDREFGTVEEAKGAIDEIAGSRNQDESTFRIFGARPPKTAEGVSEGAPTVDLGMMGKEIPPEQPGAMFWASREKIIDSPMETMTGQQWLDYLKRPTRNFNPIKDMELNDTSLSTFLSRNSKKPMAKEQLVKDFDNTLAPQLDVTVLGEHGTKDLRSLARKLQKIDLQGFRPGPVRNTLGGLKNNLDSFNKAMEGGKVDEIQGAIKKVDDLVETNFGIKNVMTEGFPQKFPFELKAPLQSMQQVAGTRAAGFRKYKRNPAHEGTQTLGGGENYREFLFSYKQPAGSPRAIEPEYKYAHDFNLDESDRMGGFVHMRTSDRTDEFGRRLLHIEEVQSDMHQKINMQQRALKKQNAEFERQGVTPEQAYEKMGTRQKEDYRDMVKQSKYAPRGDLVKEVDNVNEQQMLLIQSKIEELLAQPQTPQMATRIARLNRERAKIRKIIADKRAKAQEGDHSGMPQGPYAKTEDYNEFVMKYALRAAQEGGYDGISISSSAIKNRSLSPGSRDFGGNIAAYGPMAEGAMKKAAKKSGAKYLKTSIIDDQNRGWEIPMILLKDNPEAAAKIARGLPAYQRGGIAVNG